MKKHKWHKEIKAWANGHEIQFLYAGVWHECCTPIWEDEKYEFRVKPKSRYKKRK